jgi:pimeloyl-ACP methyl ester carboxylesterase
METIDVPVGGGALRTLRFGRGPQAVLAAHGITASGMAYGGVARHLPDGWTLLAPDLRGRGGSAGLPGPYGIDRHAEDLCRVAEHLDAGPVVLAGHSMGAYAALRAAVRRPELFARLVLIDGGLPLPVPEGADLDQVLDASLGPAIARLRETYASDDDYVGFFRAHPALGADWNDDIEAYVRYDLTGPPGGRRSRADENAVRTDGRDLLTGGASFGADLEGLALPTLLMTAPRGMFGAPPGMYPEELVAHWTERAPALRAEQVADCNHYTILLGEPAALVARRLTEPPR